MYDTSMYSASVVDKTKNVAIVVRVTGDCNNNAMVADLAPLAGTVGGGFFVGFITGYAIKKVIKLAAVIVGLFFAALAYLQYQRILNVDWERVQTFSQNGIAWLSNALAHISSNIDTTHSGTLSNVGIPLVSSVSAGFVLGMAKG